MRIKQGLVGDSILAIPVWLYLIHSLLLHWNYQYLLKLSKLGFTQMAIFPRHPCVPLGLNWLKDLIICCDEIIDDNKRGEFQRPSQGMGINGRLSPGCSDPFGSLWGFGSTVLNERCVLLSVALMSDAPGGSCSRGSAGSEGHPTSKGEGAAYSIG